MSDKPIKDILVTITSGNSKAKVKVLNKIIKLKPNETKSIAFKNPRRSFPYTKYFYKISTKNITGNEVLFQLDAQRNVRGRSSHMSRNWTCARTGLAHHKKGFYKMTGINPDILKTVNTQTYEAEEMIYGKNEIIKYPIYSNDHAIMLEPEEGKNLLWGPYQFYTRGYYIANFSIDSYQETLVRLEVVSEGGKNILAWKEVKINGAKKFPLSFEVKGIASVLEFRVKVIGNRPVLVDKIDAYPDLCMY